MMPKSSIFGFVPRTWDVITIAEALESHAPGIWGEDPDVSTHPKVAVLRSTNFTKDGKLTFEAERLAYRSIPPSKLNNKLVQIGDILLERSGGGPQQPVGRVVFVEDLPVDPVAYGNFIQRLRVDQSRILPTYLYWVLFAVHSQGITESYQQQTTGIRNLAYNDYLEIPIPFPPLPVQRRIAEILGSVDELIKIEYKETEHVNRLKWYVAEKLFTSKRSQSGFTTIGSLSEVATGGTPSRTNPAYFKGHIPWVTTTEIKYRVITETAESISEEALQQSPAKLYPKGTVLLAMYGQGATRGRVAVLGIDAAINQACAAIQPRPSASSLYIYFWLEHQYDFIRSLGHGSNQSNLNLDLVRSIPIPNLDLPSQKRIARILSTLDDRVVALKKHLTLVQQLKVGLLSRLIQQPYVLIGVEL